MGTNPERLPVGPEPEKAEGLDDETVRVLTERRENPGRLRPWDEAFRELKKARPAPQPPR